MTLMADTTTVRTAHTRVPCQGWTRALEARKRGDVRTPDRSASRTTTVSVVIPALNEAENMSRVMATIPRAELAEAGYEVEVVVVDNGSVDGTGEIAAALGATVVHQPERGYGNAYKAGFAAASGEIVATGDADCTYPFDALPTLLAHLRDRGLDFLNTNRLGRDNWGAMKPSHVVANHALTSVSRTFFWAPFRDSQSGMWIFKRSIWDRLDVRSAGMPFSQEIKNEAYRNGFACAEVPIEYRPRGGEVKLNAMRDGMRNGTQLITHRFRASLRRRTPNWPAVTPVAAPARVETVAA